MVEADREGAPALAVGPEPEHFGAQLRRLRVRAGLSRDELANRSGVSVPTILALELGRRRHPHPHTLDALAAIVCRTQEERDALASVPNRHASSEAPPVPRDAAQRPPSNLPAPRVDLIGREQEVARVRAALGEPAGRLISLTGIGGVGKTRLALHVAWEAQAVFPGGAWLVELASVADERLVPQVVADVLGLQVPPGVDPTESVRTFLAGRSALLVLDNAEHLLDACARLVERLLDGCPNVRLLVTSREPLLLAGEHQLRLPPLAAPALEERAASEDVAGYPAIQLFVARARALDPSFVLAPRNAAAVAGICARLGGIPLALELAAARVRMMSPAQILERLDDAFRLLIGGHRLAPRRQQTLLATLEWSDALLGAADRTVFRRLSVFAGGCQLEAAEAVCAGDGVAAADVLDALGRLVDKSLVVAEDLGESTRYRLLEPVRQYAWQQLVAAGELDTAQLQHAGYYLALAECAAPATRGPDQVEWFDRLERERDNWRSALRTADKRGDVPMLLRLGVALVPFWDVRGYLSEGRRWLATGLAASPQAAVPDGLRARALIGTGRLGFWLADREYPLRPFQEALELARSLGDESALAEAVTWLGAARGLQGEWPVAEELLQEGLRRHQALAEAWGSAWALLQLGRVAANAGVYSLKPELVVRARTLLEDSLQRFRSLGDRRSSGIACLLLAFSVAQGNPRRAPRLLREALDELMAVGDRAYVWIGLQSGAQILARAGQPVYAARLLGAAEGLQEAVGALLPPVGQVEVAATRALIHARLGDERLDAALCEGRRTSLEAVIAEVRAAADAVIAPLPPPAARPVVSDDLAARRQGYG